MNPFHIRHQFVQITISTSLLASFLILPGCDDYISDAIWVQESEVAVHGNNVNECLRKTLGEIPTIKLDPALSQPGDFVLTATLRKSIPTLGVNVRYLHGNSVHVLFTGKGSHESDETRAMITPLLTMITDRIRDKCVEAISGN